MLIQILLCFAPKNGNTIFGYKILILYALWSQAVMVSIVHITEHADSTISKIGGLTQGCVRHDRDYGIPLLVMT